MPPKLKTTTQLTTNQTNQTTTTTTTTTSESQSNSNQTHHHSTTKNITNNQKSQSNRLAIERFAQSVHLIEGFADTLDAIPPSLTRSLSDLKELDAVLSAPLNQVNSTLDQLLESFENPNSMRPDQRLQLLQNIVSDMDRYNLGGQDKIRVANGTCESLSHHIRQLDTTASLLISSLPPSLEPRIPASSFPSGYPKLTGSLRSKPVGGVWPNSNHPSIDHQAISSPSMLDRESIDFNHQQSPLREPESNARSIDTQPVSKRARIGASTSTSLAANSHLNPAPKEDSNQNTRSQQSSGISTKLLDQQMIFSQSSVKKHRLPQESVGLEENLSADQYSIHGLTGKSTPNSLSRQNSQLSAASPPHSILLLSNGTKNKRAGIPSNLVDHDDYIGLSHPALKINCPPSQSQSTPQQPAIAGPKKRSRKSNPASSIGKNADSTNQANGDSTSMTKRLTDQTSNPISSQELRSRTTGDHIKGTNSNSIGASSIKKAPVTAVRGANNNKSVPTAADQPALPAPVTTKRTYTKRNGMNNGGISLSKSKRAGRKKAVGVPPPPSTDSSVNNKEPQLNSNNKIENISEQQRGRVKQSPILKESVRLEDVVEGAKNKARHQKLPYATHSVSGGMQPDEMKWAKESGRIKNDDEEDEDETEYEHDGGIQERLKHQANPRNHGTSMVINQPHPSSSSKEKSSMHHHFQPNPLNRRPNQDHNPSSTDHGLLLKHNQPIVHRDPNIDVPVDILSPKESVHSNDSTRTYCFCNGEVYGDRMVACDNAECPIEWFHYRCAGLTEDPTGNWFCPDCQSKGFGRTTVGKNRTQPSSSSHSSNNKNEHVEEGEADERKEEGSMVIEGAVPLQNPSVVRS